MSVSSEQLAKSNSTKAFVTAVITNAALLSAEVLAFIVLKRKLGRIYSPRTYLPPPDKRASELPKGIWRWVPAILTSPLQDVIHKNGLDAYMFLRFLKMLLNIFFVFSLLGCLVIMPVDSVGIDSALTGLDRITWTNLPSESLRFVAHVLIAYVFTFYVLWLIRREMLHFVHTRHQFLISKEHSRLAQARTVLITSVPSELGNEQDVRQFASFVPGGVDRVWLLRDTKALNELYEKRQEDCQNLEAAYATVLRDATKAWRAKLKAEEKARKARKKHGIQDEEKVDEDDDQRKLLSLPPKELLDELVPDQKRPRHRVGFLSVFGTKVDSINWYRDEIARLNTKIKEAREHVVAGKFLGSAFIRCNLQMGAHVLAQCVSYHEPLAMYDKWMEANPRDIVWRNLDDGAVEMTARKVSSWAATAGLIFVWSFPSTFIGGLSNLDDLCQQFGWLAWLCRAPDPIPGLLQGVLPPALLAGLFALLPFILRGLAWYECIPRYSLMSVSVYRRFFLFLLIHGFLIVTLTSGLAGAIKGIVENPTKTVSTLAKQLPKSYIFFLTYMVTQGLAGAGMALIQLAPLILHYVKKWFLGRTPRQAYGVTFVMPEADFGLILPRLSLLAVIGFAYSVISPLINVLAVISFAFYYLAFKFLITQVFDQPDQSETGGMYFPMAISNLFVGLYIGQICMAALFFLRISVPESRASALAEGILMIILLVITIFAQVSVNKVFNPIISYLPMSLATQKMAKQYEREKRRSRMLGIKDDDEGMDLFNIKRIKTLRKRIKKIPKRMGEGLDELKGKVISPRPSRDSRRSKETMTESEAIATGVAPPPPQEFLTVQPNVIPVQPMTSTSSNGTMVTALNSPQQAASASKENVAAEPAPAETEAGPVTSKQEEAMAEAERKEDERQAEQEQRQLEERAQEDQAHSYPPRPSSRASSVHSSKSSVKSGKSGKSKKSNHIRIDAPAPAGVSITIDGDEDDEGEPDADDFDEHAFDHPSTYVNQPWIWIPKDVLGLSEMFVRELREKGVDASDLGSTMDEKGVVEVTRNPPDEAWLGGHDQ